MRVTWKNAKKILDALISKECLANYTWSGKAKQNKKTKNSLRKLNFIHDLIMTALRKLDSTYDFKAYKDDMVKHIVKRAHEHEKNEPLNAEN